MTTFVNVAQIYVYLTDLFSTVLKQEVFLFIRLSYYFRFYSFWLHIGRYVSMCVYVFFRQKEKKRFPLLRAVY